MPERSRQRIDCFGLAPGSQLAGKYKVLEQLGSGWEGEVYLVREKATRIERTAKLFFPARNPKDKAVRRYARQLHKLRHCPFVIQYYTQERTELDGVPVSLLVSEYVEGELLTDFIKRQPGRRLQPFQAVHLLYHLATGLECVHEAGDYHGDLHADNIIIQRHGLGFELKLIDMFRWSPSTAEGIRNDVFDLVRIFYDSLGGRRHYAKQPEEVKAICCGLKRSLMLRKFRTAGELRYYLENLHWS